MSTQPPVAEARVPRWEAHLGFDTTKEQADAERLQSPSASPSPDLEDPHLSAARQAIVDRIEQAQAQAQEKERNP